MYSKLLSLVTLISALNAPSALSLPGKGTLGAVGVLSPEGNMMLYYREGDQIKIKSCAPLTILGATPNEARNKCEGPIRSVHVESFKKGIRANLGDKDFGHLKPLTEAEIKAYEKDGTTSEDLQKMIAEVDKINGFIQAYGEKNAPMVRLEELNKILKDKKNLTSALKKIQEEIDKAINLISDEGKVAIVNSTTNDCNGANEKPFLYTVLKDFNTKRIPCGLKGSLDARIKDCQNEEGAQRGEYILVHRSINGKEVYKNQRTGLLWSHKLPNQENFANALTSCKAELEELGNITGVNWRLPTEWEMKQETMSIVPFPITRTFPELKKHWYWTSTHSENSPWARAYNGYSEKVEDVEKSLDSGSILCVANSW